MVTVEEIHVCMQAWMYISGVPQSTFFCYQMHVKDHWEAMEHGNIGISKPRKHIQQAIVSLKCILEMEANHMPHCTRTMKGGEKVVSMYLPSTFQWKGKMKEINDVNAAFGLKEILTSNLSKIGSLKFSKYEVKKPEDNVAQCATCEKYKELRKIALAGSSSAMMWQQRLDKHLTTARTHQDLYYINWFWSLTFPHECLMIMHNKMDHSKTVCPVFLHKSKDTDGLMKLLVSIIGMIAHGHGDVCYAHYGLDLFSHDLNYTIGFVAKLLRDLELPPKSSSWKLFMNLKFTNLFKAVLKGVDICNALLQKSLQT